MTSVENILNVMGATPSKNEEKMIRKAYLFAENAYLGAQRYSGEPYFIHAYETAKILAELGKQPTTIVAGLLHDVLEDTNIKSSEIEKEFGKEVLFLVEGVTKLGKLRYRGAKRHSESLRKLLVATSQDIRVIIIRLADRLHNMRTLKYVPEAKQNRIASETLEIYAPIAYRLGIRKINRELEDLSFPFVYPKEYEEIKELVSQKHKKDLWRLEKFHKSVQKLLAKNGITKIHTDYRIKSLYSLYKKYLRKDKDIEKIYDISALRLIVPTIEDCYISLGIIHNVWKPLPGRIKDYISSPKTNGYQSLHTTVFTGDGGLIEIQIKTEEMHKEAEYGIASHIGYKEAGPKTALSATLLWLKNLLPSKGENDLDEEEGSLIKKINIVDSPKWIKELAEHHSTIIDHEEFVSGLKNEFLKERIFVFTPKGDVVDLPIDATPIDFAYSIHSDVGDHISETKINGKMASLHTCLKNGDTVEIITKENKHPNKKWLEYAKTITAKKHIKKYLQENNDI